MLPFKIFVVEDDRFYGELLEYHLSLNPDYEVKRFGTGKEALAQLHQRPGVVTLDYSLPDMTGAEILKRIKYANPETQVVIISGQEDISTAVHLLREGAYDYIVKDDDTTDRLWNTVVKARETIALKGEIAQLKEEIGQKYDFRSAIIGNSTALQRVFALIEKAVKTNINVSITGETGTGKELVAKSIHYHSDRKKKSFVAVNMAAIPRDLMESELFGYEKGAFTGALTRRLGKFEEASGGTIFLDEIGELDLHLQSKILRVLQEREITRIGGGGNVKIDVRVIVATHKNLAEEVKKGNFREDLFYRLLGLPIELPPLRERGNDVLILAKYFVDEFCKDNKLAKLPISSGTKEKLLKYPFPGNIRELKAIMELAVVMSNGESLEPEDITFSSGNNIPHFTSEELPLKEYERRIIRYFLEKYDNNVMLVAEKLDIGKSTIYRMMQNGEL